MLAVTETTVVILASIAVVVLAIYWLSTRLTPDNSVAKAFLPQQFTIKVQGGPDHGHAQQEVMPQDLESFFGMLRSLTKFKAIQSTVSFVLEPEPVVTITRDAKHLERFKPDPVPQRPSRAMPPTGYGRHGSMEELGG
jgi:hypothetical protein